MLFGISFKGASRRIKSKDKSDRYDIFDLEKYNKIMNEYFAIEKEEEGIYRIDDNELISNVSKEIINILNRKI